MIIFPVINLKQGFARRVPKNGTLEEAIYDEDPAVAALHWVAQGAEWLHVVNMDVVNMDGSPAQNREHVNALNLQRLGEIQRVASVPIQFSGGIESMEDIRLALESGADRVVLEMGTVENRPLITQAIEIWGPERIVVSIDAPDISPDIGDGRVGENGANGAEPVDITDIGHQIQAMGVRRVIYTDFSRDGRLRGVNAAEAAALGEISDLRVIVRGGVASLADIEQLKQVEHHSIEGVISNRAIYNGHVDLPTAIAIGHRPLEHYSAGVIPVRRTKDGIEFLLLYNWYFEIWEFPRGPLEMRETTAESARRSFKELTGLDIRRFSEGCNPRLNYTVTIRDYEVQHTVVYYLAEVEDGEVELGDENHCEEHWGDYQSVWELLTETAPEQLPALDRAVACLQESVD